MKINRIKVEHFAGLTSGLSLDELGPGVTLILGPNAAGKTRTCTAIRALLWPETYKGDEHPRLAAALAVGEELLVVERNGGRVTWSQNGQEIARPVLPDGRVSSCYVITIDELFNAVTGEYAREVERDVSGGYDLRSARKKPPALQATYNSLQKAEQKVLELSRPQRQLRNEQDSLDRLRLRLSETAALSERLRAIGSAETLLQARAERAEVEAALSELPSALGRLVGGEVEQLDELNAERERARTALQEAHARIEHASRRRASQRLPEEGVPPERLRMVRSLIDDLKKRERELDDAAARKTAVEARCEALQSRLELLGLARDQALCDPKNLQGLEESILGYERLVSARAQVKERMEQLERQLEQVNPQSRDTLLRAREILRSWRFLSAQRMGILLVAVLLLQILFSVLIVAFAWPSLEPYGAGAAAVAVLLGAAAPAAIHSRARRQRRELEQAYPAEGAPAPVSWVPEEVQQVAFEIERRLELVYAQQGWSAELDALGVQLLSKERDLREAQHEQEALARRLGILQSVSPVSLAVATKDLLALVELLGDHAEVSADVERLSARRQQLLSGLNAQLAEYLPTPREGSGAIEAFYEELRERATAYGQASRELESLERETLQLRERETAVEQKRAALFERLGLQPEDTHALKELAALRPRYLEHRQRLSELVRDCRRLEAELGEVAPSLLTLGAEGLSAEREHCRKEVEEHSDLRQQITAIELRVRQAEGNRTLCAAREERDQLEERLSELREETLDIASRSFLLDDIETEYRDLTQPAVVARSRELFSRFTHGRYQLNVVYKEAQEAPDFTAQDMTSLQHLPLDLLSRGTRLQLLLAVRLAFAERYERGYPMPLLLDEALGHSDPERYERAVEALLEAARTGRQILYFSCNPVDQHHWLEIAARAAPEVDVKVIRLDGQTDATREEPPLSERARVEMASLPNPGPMTLAEYSRLLTVPAIECNDPIETVHVAHLVDDAATLYGLLSAKLERYGQLKTLDEQVGLEQFGIDRQTSEALYARAAIIEASLSAWRIGRGRALTPAVIRDALPDKSKHLNEVIDLFFEHRRDNRAFMNALDPSTETRGVKRFQQPIFNKMREQFYQEGFLVEEEPLAEEQFYATVLDRCKRWIGDSDTDRNRALHIARSLWAGWTGSASSVRRSGVEVRIVPERESVPAHPDYEEHHQ